MYHTIYVILLAGFIAPTCSAQEQLPDYFPEFDVKPLTTVEPAAPEVTDKEKPNNERAFSGDPSAQGRMPPLDTDRNGILDQAELDRMPSFLRELFASRGVVLKAGMTADVMRPALSVVTKVPASSPPTPASLIKVFALKYTEAASTAKLLADLITTKPFRAAADERTNSVIATGTNDQLLAVEALLMKLDEAPRVPDSEPQQDGQSAVGVDAAKQIQQQIAQLRKEFETADKQAHELAESLRRAPNATKKTELRTAVQRAFTLRQSLLRAQLVEMQTRLLQTQQSIDMRERVADQIVDRRVEDLLNPQLRWDGLSRTQISDSKATTAPQVNNPPAPTGPGLSEDISPEAWVQAQDGLRLAIVVKSENALWNESQEVQYVVENVSSSPIRIKEQRNDQLASLLDVRQTSQAQVQTWPRINSGVTGFTGTEGTIEILPGQQSVVARVWIGVVEKETDATPNGDPQLLVIDPNAWKFQNKIYLLRGSLQLDPDKPTVTIHSVQVAIAFHKPETSATEKAEAPLLDAVVGTTELEGDWHLVALSDNVGGQREVRPNNRTYRGDQSTVAWAGGGHTCRIKINPDVKTIWSFSKEEDGTFTMDHYELKGDRLFLRDKPESKATQVFERGHVRIPNVVPLATGLQEARWRSAVVEILVSGKADVNDTNPRKIGFGIIFAADGTLVSHMSGGWSNAIRDWPNVDAKFDDGSVVPLEIAEEGGSGFVILRPKETVNLNHHFAISVAPTEIGDQVYVGQMAVSSRDPNQYGMSATIVTLAQTDRRVATLGAPVWQLNSSTRLSNLVSLPVLSKDGELLAVTMADTGGLLLAVPVTQLQEMFPMTFDPARRD